MQKFLSGGFVVRAAGLAGCSDNNPHPRIDVPAAQGNYSQFYLDEHTAVAEIAGVNAVGKVTSQVAPFNSRTSFDRPVTNETVLFEHCGLFTFREKPDGTVSSSHAPYGSQANCPFKPVPAQWQRVGPQSGAQ